MQSLGYVVGQGVNGVLFGLSQAQVAKEIGEPSQRDVITSLDWVPHRMRDDFAGMVIAEHRNVYGRYVLQLTYIDDCLNEIKILPEAGSVLCAGINLFAPRHRVLSALFDRFGLPLENGRDLYFVSLGLLYSIQERDDPVVCFTTGKIQALNVDEFIPLTEDDAAYLIEPHENIN